MARFESFEQGTPGWIEHSSPEPAAAKEFYGQLFGWDYDDTPMTGDDGQDLGAYSTARIGEDQVAGLGPVMAEGQPSSWGVYLAADDVDAAAERAAGAGGQVMVPPMDVPDGGRIAWVQDPVGAAVGLWQAPAGGAAVRANEHGTNIWNELVTADAQPAVPFYEQVLGLQAEQIEMEGSPYTTLNVAGRPVAGTTPPQADGIPPHWNVCFNVDDCDTTARAQELGGQEVAAPFDVPGIGRIAVLSDPQGAAFSVMQNPPEQ